jgi:hypothetical protein
MGGDDVEVGVPVFGEVAAVDAIDTDIGVAAAQSVSRSRQLCAKFQTERRSFTYCEPPFQYRRRITAAPQHCTVGANLPDNGIAADPDTPVLCEGKLKRKG